MIRQDTYKPLDGQALSRLQDLQESLLGQNLILCAQKTTLADKIRARVEDLGAIQHMLETGTYDEAALEDLITKYTS